ncbi:MAG: winged helix DNA-binding domain-containing protein [Acetobacterium sp.]
MNNNEIIDQRLWNQLISMPRFNRPAEVVSWLGAIQAQNYASAKWSIGARNSLIADSDVEQAIADKAIIRTWMMRGTLHFVAKADIRWMLELLTPQLIARSALRYHQLDLDDPTFEKSKEVFYRELMIAKQLTRHEMVLALEKAKISTAGQRGYHLLVRAAQDGLICFGPQRGKQQTFVLLDQWAPEAKSMERSLALSELTLRYFSSRGPATLKDFVWWSALKVSDAKEGLKAVSSSLKSKEINGQIYWMPPPHDNAWEDCSKMHLLPGYDEYLLGYKDREAVVDKQDAAKIAPGNNGVFNPTIIIKGRVVGIWKTHLKKDVLTITSYPFAPFNELERMAFIEAAEKYGKFLKKAVVFN